MCREQPSSPGTPSPSFVKATLQQPTGQADTHAVAPQWSMGDFAWGQRKSSTVGASSMSSQHASDTCPASAIGKTAQNAVHPAVCSSAQSVVSHSSAQQWSKSAGQDTVQDATPQYCITDFGMRKPVPSRVQTSSMTSTQHASGTGAKLPPQASASATILPATHASAKTAQISHTTAQTCTKTNNHDKPSLANNAAPDMSSQNGSEISTKPSDRQPAEEKASGSEQSAPVNSQVASDIRTDPMRQVAFNQFSLADDFPSLDTLRQPEQPAAKKSTRHSPIAHGASAHSQKSQASSKKSGNKSRDADAANKTSSTSSRAQNPQVMAQATTAPIKGPTTASKDATATTARAFHMSSSDSSDEYHSSSDAVELRSSRLSPHSSPSQASTGSSYTTARSQTSNKDQMINHHSQSVCMTSAAAAPAAVSNSTQGVKQARSVTAEPGHDAQAEHQTRTQGCKQTSRPFVSPQTENIEHLKNVAAECDPLSSMHPGVGSGVDPSVPSAQAGLDEQVHSLDDTLSSALQELLLTEDRQDFAQSIQVGCNMKHICFLPCPKRYL